MLISLSLANLAKDFKCISTTEGNLVGKINMVKEPTSLSHEAKERGICITGKTGNRKVEYINELSVYFIMC